MAKARVHSLTSFLFMRVHLNAYISICNEQNIVYKKRNKLQRLRVGVVTELFLEFQLNKKNIFVQISRIT